MKARGRNAGRSWELSFWKGEMLGENPYIVSTVATQDSVKRNIHIQNTTSSDPTAASEEHGYTQNKLQLGETSSAALPFI